MGQLEPYIDKAKKVYRCPSNRGHEYGSMETSDRYISYGLNLVSFNGGKKLPRISKPSITIYLADSNNDNKDPNLRGFFVQNSGLYQHYHVGTRHSGGPNVLFVDGHVAWYPFETVDKSNWWE
ncbi:MAG: hypothetical protein KAX20_03510 [Candidatus Omnitrophica bacterium]|nr:hypothetical protein [Candidatus Omnitrophota bacterium]